jgi:hypothetical protein
MAASRRAAVIFNFGVTNANHFGNGHATSSESAQYQNGEVELYG